MFDHREEMVISMAIWAGVLQPWSGNTWGRQHSPRVGADVAGSLTDGSPDAPVIIGSFYNEKMRSVFPILALQTRQGFRSRSTARSAKEVNAARSAPSRFPNRWTDTFCLYYFNGFCGLPVGYASPSISSNMPAWRAAAAREIASILAACAACAVWPPMAIRPATIVYLYDIRRERVARRRRRRESRGSERDQSDDGNCSEESSL